MKQNRFIWSSRFKKAFRKLSLEVQGKALDVLRLLGEDLFHSQLKTHKLHGKLRGVYALSVDFSYRILFRPVGDHVFEMYDIGDHEIYK